MRPSPWRISVIILCMGGIGAGGLHAQEDVDVPYWASIKADTANSRVGPALDYQIAWVYKRKNLPVKVIKRYHIWRQIEDPDGTQTWMHARLLVRTRTAIVIGEVRPMRAGPSPDERIVWRAEPGVVGKLGGCSDGYCEFDVNGQAGFIEARGLWGVGKP